MRILPSTPAVLAAALAMVSTAPAVAHAQDVSLASYDSAYFAWRDGDYPTALGQLERALLAPGGGQVLAPAALLTGELHRTVEVAPDGREPRWSPDGRWAAYETEDEDEVVTTHLVRLDGARVVERASVRGRGLVFDADGGRAAYLTVSRTGAWRAARDSIDRSIEVTDWPSYRAKMRALARLDAEHARSRVRDLDTGEERELRTGRLAATYEIAFAPDGGPLYVVGAAPGDGPDVTDIYAIDPGADGSVRKVTDGPGRKSRPMPVPGGRHLVHAIGAGGIGVVDLHDGESARYAGHAPTLAADGSAVAFLAAAEGPASVDANGAAGAGVTGGGPEAGGENAIVVVRLADGRLRPRAVVRTDDGLDNPALSPDGRRVVYQRMPREDWDLYVVGADGAGERRVTWDIGDDIYPRFVDDRRVLAVIGEGRHRRSFLYDLDALEAAADITVADGGRAAGSADGRGGSSTTAAADAVRRAVPDGAPRGATARTEPLPAPVRPTAAARVRTRLFHNNTIRTIAPEYAWSVDPAGERVLIVAERDGDTISPERGLYLVDLTRTVGRDDVLARIRAMAESERRLRDRGREAFAPIEAAVRDAVADVSVSRVYEYERELFTYGSKFITEPGNRRAIAYLERTLESFGYDVELEWFEPLGERTANVIATLRGTGNPDLVYVISSHFDSSSRGPGADDNTSGTAALLETARVLAGRPQPATIQFAFFTGEEAGLHGSREFVRRAVANGKHIAGALNNDMVGFANDHRLDNTIRYSNAGIRDLQHAAAILFSDLILYDAKYYKSTDAHAYYEAYGDIVGGIGSYPVLSSPHYHEPHDVLEIVNHRLITEVAKTTVASIMRLASSPARLTGLEVVARDGDAVELRWDAAPEHDVARYVVARGPEDATPRRTVETREPHVRLGGIESGTVVRVKAVNAAGLDGWDWAWVAVP